MTPRKAYEDQRYHAIARGIPWEFEYHEWLEMWLVTGKWQERGRGKGKYQMCRFFDEGAYSPRNCYIGTFEENMVDARKVTDKQTIEIIDLYRNTRLSQREIGERFGIDQSTVSKIVNGKRRTSEHYSASN